MRRFEQKQEIVQIGDKGCKFKALFSFSINYKRSEKLMLEEANFIEEKDYCDESELMLKEYAHPKAVEFSEELDFIRKWISDESQTSLLITGQSDSGKKTLLYSLLKESKEEHPDWLFICHFASMTPVYSNILYKTMIQLRNHFKIEQKVDLNDQKLRRYFKYWLEVTSDFLQKQYLGYNSHQVPKVVIIMEGIDLCLDARGNYVEPQFWLPFDIPNNIKLILTAKEEDSVLLGSCVSLNHQLTQQKRERVIQSFGQRTRDVAAKSKEMTLYSLYVLNEMLKRKDHFKASRFQLPYILSEYISHISLPDFSQQVIKSLLYTLTLTRKGLKNRDISAIVAISIDKWEYFYRCFSFMVVESRGYFIICNRAAHHAIQKLADPKREKARVYRNSIVRAIKKESIHLRSLQEIVYHLLLSQNYSELKEVICRVQNFIMLYTPFSKELLCQCWVRLESLQQFDPVFEYNKAIESYASHYYPKEEDLYKIIFQISMFFKEYAEFENSKTPAFRHPLIKGEADHLQSIGIFEELSSLAMVGKCKVYKMKPLQKMQMTRMKPEITLSKVENKDEKKESGKGKRDLEKKSRVQLKSKQETRTASVKSKRSVKKSEQIEDASEMSTPSSSQIVRQSEALEQEKGFSIEQLNVGIVSNQQKFKHHFLGQMKEYLQIYIVPLKKSSHKQKSLTFQSDESDNDEQSMKQKGQKQFRVDIQKLKDSFVLKRYKEYLEQSYHKTGQEVQYYYYKQWIWLQFPWLCQTVKHVYSTMLKECLPGSIHFMSPLKQFSLIRDVIRIARSAKETKLGIYTEKKIQIYSIKPVANREETPFKPFQIRRDYTEAKKSGAASEKKEKSLQAASRYKVNLKNIDEDISKEKREESNLRLKGYNNRMTAKGNSSLPCLNMFVTEAVNKESRMFPVLKKSKFALQTSRRRTQKENHQDGRDYTLLIRKYNEIKHENDMLVQKIEEAKRLQLQNSDKSKEDTATLMVKIGQLEERKINLQKSNRNQVQLRKKLQVIIKVCELNKMYGSETDYLSNYLDSIKKMISGQEDRVKQTKDRIHSLVENAKITIKKLRNTKKELKIIKEENILPYTSICPDTTRRDPAQLGFEEIEGELKQVKRVTKIKNSKKCKNKSKHFYSTTDYELLENEIGVVYGKSGNEERIQQFADKYQKLKELRLKNADLNKDYQQKKKRIEFIHSESKLQLEGDERDRQIRTANLLGERKKELLRVKNRSLLLIHAKSSLKAAESC